MIQGDGSIPEIRTILFDAVGTLIYPHPPVAQVYYEAGLKVGSRLTPEQIAERFRQAFARWTADDLPAPLSEGLNGEQRERRRWQTIVADVFRELPEAGGQLFETLWKHFAHPKHWRLFDDIQATWSDLTAAGFRLGIASNFDERLGTICRALPPLSECRDVFISSRVGFAKPQEGFFRRVETALQISGENILLVGDDEANDYAGASKAGWQALLIDRRGRKKGSHVIHSLAEIKRRIEI